MHIVFALARVSSLACRVSLGFRLVSLRLIMVKQIPLLVLILMVERVFSGVLLTRAIIRLIEVF